MQKNDYIGFRAVFLRIRPEKVCTEQSKNDKMTKAISKNEEGYTMSKFLKFLVNLILVCAILTTGAIFLPPMLGVNTTVVDSEKMDTNLPVGSITYSNTVHVIDLQSGDEVLKEVGSSVHAYIIETGDVNTGKYTVRDAIDKTSGTTEISLRNNVSKVVLTVPYLGYIVMIMQTTEGMIIGILLVVFVIILFVLSELWKHNEEEDEADEEDIVDDDGEQVEEILDDEEAREAVESAGAASFGSVPETETEKDNIGDGSGKVGGDTKEVKIAAAPDTSVEVRRGDTAFLVNELSSIGTGKEADESEDDLSEALSGKQTGNRGTFFAGEVQAEAADEESNPEADAEAAEAVKDADTEAAEAVKDADTEAAGSAGAEMSADSSAADTEKEETRQEIMKEESEPAADEIDWTKFEVGEPVPEAAARKTGAASDAPEQEEAGEASVKADAPNRDEIRKDTVSAAAEKTDIKNAKTAARKPAAKRFRPVERLTLEEILEHAKKSGAADETQASRDTVTGVDFVDYSELL